MGNSARQENATSFTAKSSTAVNGSGWPARLAHHLANLCDTHVSRKLARGQDALEVPT
jgi:hypothetical protein